MPSRTRNLFKIMKVNECEDGEGAEGEGECAVGRSGEGESEEHLSSLGCDLSAGGRGPVLSLYRHSRYMHRRIADTEGGTGKIVDVVFDAAWEAISTNMMRVDVNPKDILKKNKRVEGKLARLGSTVKFQQFTEYPLKSGHLKFSV